MKTNFKNILCISVVSSLWLANQAFSDTIVWDTGGTDDDWSTLANWAGDAKPGAADTALINLNSSMDITQAESTASFIIQNAAGTTTVNMTGGSLGLSGFLNIGHNNVGATLGKGAFNLSGGDVSAASMTLGANNNAEGEMLISGGSVGISGAVTIGNTALASLMEIQGSGASSLSSLSVSFNANGTMKFQLGASGVTPWNATGTFNGSAGNLIVDFGTYVHSGSGTDIIPLVNAANLQAFSNVSYQNDAAFNYTLVQDTGTSQDIFLEVTQIPEPSTFALLGAGIVLLLGKRKRITGK